MKLLAEELVVGEVIENATPGKPRHRARLASIASGAGTRTRQARPKNSMTRITYQLRSNCHHFSPCRAEVGKAWWLLCQPSPIASTPKIVLLRDSSWVLKGRVPHRWQTELMLQVTWCTRKIRASPPQRNPSSAPFHVIVIRPPRAVGIMSPATAHSGKVALTTRSTFELTRSGMYRERPTWSPSKTHPTWECHSPLM